MAEPELLRVDRGQAEVVTDPQRSWWLPEVLVVPAFALVLLVALEGWCFVFARIGRALR